MTALTDNKSGIKKQLIDFCIQKQNVTIEAAREAMIRVQDSANEETAGGEDKFESFREQCQIDRDMYAKKINESMQGLAILKGYKEAVVQYGAKDIVMTTKLSGTPCTVINTPYMQKIGTEQNWLEAFLNKNRNFKKLAKMLTFYRGMKSLEKAAFGATYKTVWCAGPSIEYVKSIEPVKAIVARLKEEFAAS